MKKTVVRLIVIFFNLFVSLALAVLFVTGRHKFHFEASSVWFCIFSFLVSLWALNATPWMTLMFENRVAACFMEYLLLMLMVPSAVLYIRDVFEEENTKSRVSSIIILAGCANILVLTGLHLTGIREFRETVTVTHLLMITALAYSFYTLIRSVRSMGITRKSGVAIFSLTVLAVFYMLDLAAFYLIRMTDVFGWLGISFCIIAMGGYTLVDMFETVKDMQKNEAFKELAVRDVDTGLYNKNAYNIWLEETPLSEQMYIITYDLNDLKKCNDVFGHLAGDRYLRDAAGILKDIFGKYGSTYRLGGDEFLTTIEDKDEKWIRRRLVNLEEKMAVYNETSDLVQMRIAYGYARYE